MESFRIFLNLVPESARKKIETLRYHDQQKNAEIAEQFEAITIKRQMKIIAAKAVNSKLYYKEIIEEFERTLLQTLLEKYDFNVSRISPNIKATPQQHHQEDEKAENQGKEDETVAVVPNRRFGRLRGEKT